MMATSGRELSIERVVGALPGTGLPPDRARGPVSAFNRQGANATLERSAWKAYAAFCADENVSLFAGLLAAWNILLFRYSGQEELVSGVATSSLLPVRVDMGGEPSVREAINRVVGSLELVRSQEAVSIREALAAARQDLHTPLYWVVFMCPGFDRGDAGPHVTESDEFEEELAGCDVVFSVERVRERLELRADYDADLFDSTSIECLLRCYEVLLQRIPVCADASIAAVPLLPEEEERRLLAQQSARDEFPVEQCVHERFEAQARQTPEAIALTWPGPTPQQLSYGELDARANQLAHYLQALGVEPNVLVGLYLERSLDLVIAILGVLKAGGAYLPMDLGYPPERLAFMLSDAKAPLLLTQHHLRERLPATEARVLCLDTEKAEIAKASTDQPESRAGINDLIYTIYTSGSTGQPKGALISHHHVARLFRATEAWYGFDASDVWTLFHSCAFDFTVWELWGALAYGGRLVVVPYLTTRSPDAFHELLWSEGVTVLNQTPSAFRPLIRVDEQEEERRLSALRYVIFGGEALELQSLAPWFARYGDQSPQLVNMYGITETTVHVTYRPLKQSDLYDAPGSVIGVPLPDLQLYLLDAGMHPVPPGVPGEVFVGGAGVARGYLNRPRLTRERFVSNPHDPKGTGVLYRTGDLARWLPGGDLQYLGRIDHQVKIRGFRIELGEIESAINGHPQVRESLVVAATVPDGEKVLTAYVVTAREREPTVADLRARLSQRLPDYMVPAAFVFLDRLPLTPHGKVDRSALPAPEVRRPDLETDYIAPQNEVEETIAGVYREVLQLNHVGVQDNFFELGGDSLRVGRVVALLRERLAADLDMVKLFEHPTVRALADFLQREDGAQDAPAAGSARGDRKRAAAARRRAQKRERVP